MCFAAWEFNYFSQGMCTGNSFGVRGFNHVKPVNRHN
jgi:hypothetical protein